MILSFIFVLSFVIVAFCQFFFLCCCCCCCSSSSLLLLRFPPVGSGEARVRRFEFVRRLAFREVFEVEVVRGHFAQPIDGRRRDGPYEVLRRQCEFLEQN